MALVWTSAKRRTFFFFPFFLCGDIDESMICTSKLDTVSQRSPRASEMDPKSATPHERARCGSGGKEKKKSQRPRYACVSVATFRKPILSSLCASIRRLCSRNVALRAGPRIYKYVYTVYTLGSPDSAKRASTSAGRRINHGGPEPGAPPRLIQERCLGGDKAVVYLQWDHGAFTREDGSGCTH